MLACGTLEATEGYQQAKQAASMAVFEAKPQVWEEFGEALERDFWVATRGFWQTSAHICGKTLKCRL